VKPTRLLEKFAWTTGICWKCEAVDFVAVCGEVTGTRGPAVEIELCALCIFRVDQMRASRLALRDAPRTREQLVAYFRASARSPEHEQALRDWIASLMERLDERDVASLVFGAHGRVALPEAS
jgi:hypothetical protein